MSTNPKLLDWLGTRSQPGAGGVLGWCWDNAFILILDKVREAGRAGFRRLGTLSARSHQPAVGTEGARDFTATGGIAVLTLVTLAVVGFLLITRKYGRCGSF